MIEDLIAVITAKGGTAVGAVRQTIARIAVAATVAIAFTAWVVKT